MKTAKKATGFCLTANPGSAGAAYGFADMGPYQGGQAELLRVPYADFNLPGASRRCAGARERLRLLSDIFPTGWHATELAGLLPGESIAIYGAGPVGLMAAHSAMIKGASQVFVVDNHPDRLKLAAQLGATPINSLEKEAVDQILNLTHGKGTDRGGECVGYQCCDKHGHEINHLTMNNLVASTKPTGGIGAVGVFVPQDPGAQNDLAKEGKMAFDFGAFWFKGQQVRTGQANVKAYNRRLAELIHHGRAKPSQIISHSLKLSEGPDAYKHFDARDEGWTKVILKPAA